ncbi:MAG: class I SAM-dependent methyltransferase [Aggregatilineales bacterium]
MSDYTQSTRYQRCQAIFDRAYPDFKDAGQRYTEMIKAAIDAKTLLLDVGCGRDSLAGDVLQQAAGRTGIDLSFEDLQHNTSMDVAMLADAGKLPFPDEHFDVLISQWVVEHFEDPDAAFTEMQRVLKPGGKLIFLTTNAHNYIPVFSRLVPDGLQHTIIQTFLRRPAHESFPTFYRANTRRQLENIAANTGFTIEKLEYAANPFYLTFSVPVFRLAMLYERFTDASSRQRFKLYLIATLQKRL